MTAYEAYRHAAFLAVEEGMRLAGLGVDEVVGGIEHALKEEANKYENDQSVVVEVRDASPSLKT